MIDPPDQGSAPTRVLVVEERPTAPDRPEPVLRSAGFEVMGTCTTAPEALALAGSHRVDVYLIDVDLAYRDGGELIRDLLAIRPNADVVLRAGGGRWVDAAALPKRSGRRDAILSPREREVLRQLASGLNGPEAAEALGLSVETVRTHVRHAMAKLSARTRTQAVAAALQRGELAVDR